MFNKLIVVTNNTHRVYAVLYTRCLGNMIYQTNFSKHQLHRTTYLVAFYFLSLGLTHVGIVVIPVNARG